MAPPLAQVTVSPTRAPGEPIGLDLALVYVTWSGRWMPMVLLRTSRRDLLESVYATFKDFPGVGTCGVMVVYGRRSKVVDQPGA